MNEKRLLSSARMRRIILTVVIGFLFLIIYSTVWSYNRDIRQAENASLMRLAGIANSLALQIDGDLHQSLTQRYGQKDAITNRFQDSAYHLIHQVLARNYQANMLKTPLYTIFFDSLQKTYMFGVTSSEQPYYRHTYNSAPTIYMEQDTDKRTPHGDGGAMIPMYEDEFGMWLSAFAVIRNSKGEKVAMVQADEKFDTFLNRERSDILKNIIISICVFCVVLLILIKILQSILQKEWRDKQALAQANEQVQQLDIFRKEMITNISHDLRTPIANIMGFTETLHQKWQLLPPTDIDKYLLVILKESKRLNLLLRGLFDLSLLETGQIKLDKEQLNLSDLVHDVLQKYMIQANDKNVKMLTDIHDNIPIIEGDIRWIDRVIQNLLDNALKYVNENGIIKLSLYAEQSPTLGESGVVHFKVCNSGNPIPPELLPQVFDRYFKYSKNKEDNSTGLGLAIVKRVIDMHEGRVWAEVNQDITTLRFSLPI